MSTQIKNHPLQKLIELEIDARDFGFEWPDSHMILEQIRSECDEVEEVLTNKQTHARLQEEVGDLLHAVISLCQFLNFNTEEILGQTTKKFDERIKALKQITQQKGLQNLKDQPINVLLEMWALAKKKEQNE